MAFPTCSLKVLTFVLGRLGRVGLHLAGELDLIERPFSLATSFNPASPAAMGSGKGSDGVWSGLCVSSLHIGISQESRLCPFSIYCHLMKWYFFQ